jgi:hypothetical protein
MIRFQCDGCARLKGDGELWILGFAAENIGVTSARREIAISSSWDRPRAVEPLAVHFCSDECRARYVSALFGSSAEIAGIEDGAVTVTRQRVKRVIPGAVVDTVVAEKKRPMTARRRVVRRKAS